MVSLLSFPLAFFPTWTGKEERQRGMHKPDNTFVSAMCGRLIEDPVDELQVSLCKVSVGKHPVLSKAH